LLVDYSNDADFFNGELLVDYSNEWAELERSNGAGYYVSGGRIYYWDGYE